MFKIDILEIRSKVYLIWAKTFYRSQWGQSNKTQVL